MKEKKGVQNKLNKVMLEYYELLLKEKKLEEKKRKEEEKTLDKKIQEVHKLWDEIGNPRFPITLLCAASSSAGFP